MQGVQGGCGHGPARMAAVLHALFYATIGYARPIKATPVGPGRKMSLSLGRRGQAKPQAAI